MRIELQTSAGEPVRDVDIPKMTPFPHIVTLGARAFRFFDHKGDADGLIYREALMVSLEGYLPGGGMRDEER